MLHTRPPRPQANHNPFGFTKPYSTRLFYIFLIYFAWYAGLIFSSVEAGLANQRGVSGETDQSEAGRCHSFSDGDGDGDGDGRVGQEEENNYAPFPTKIQILLRIVIKIMSY